jgi:hypothetical protein
MALDVIWRVLGDLIAWINEGGAVLLESDNYSEYSFLAFSQVLVLVTL